MKREGKISDKGLHYRLHPNSKVGIEFYRLDSYGKKIKGTTILLEEFSEVMAIIKGYKAKYKWQTKPNTE